MSYGISYYANWSLDTIGAFNEYRWFDSYSELTAWEKEMLSRYGENFIVHKTGSSAEHNNIFKAIFG